MHLKKLIKIKNYNNRKKLNIQYQLIYMELHLEYHIIYKAKISVKIINTKENSIKL